MSSNRILITFFGPFNSFLINPSELVAEKLQKLFLEDSNIEFRRLDVSFNSIEHFLESDLNQFDVIIELGVATKSERVKLELNGTNFIKGVDNNNFSKNGLIATNGSASITTNFDEDILNNLTSIYPEQISKSESAGKYLCNYLYYQSLNKFPEKKILFIHVANFMGLSNAVSLDKQVEIIVTLIKNKKKNIQ